MQPANVILQLIGEVLNACEAGQTVNRVDMARGLSLDPHRSPFIGLFQRARDDARQAAPPRFFEPVQGQAGLLRCLDPRQPLDAKKIARQAARMMHKADRAVRRGVANAEAVRDLASDPMVRDEGRRRVEHGQRKLAVSRMSPGRPIYTQPIACASYGDRDPRKEMQLPN